MEKEKQAKESEALAEENNAIAKEEELESTNAR